MRPLGVKEEPPFFQPVLRAPPFHSSFQTEEAEKEAEEQRGKGTQVSRLSSSVFFSPRPYSLSPSLLPFPHSTPRKGRKGRQFPFVSPLPKSESCFMFSPPLGPSPASSFSSSGLRERGRSLNRLPFFPFSPSYLSTSAPFPLLLFCLRFLFKGRGVELATFGR